MWTPCGSLFLIEIELSDAQIAKFFTAYGGREAPQAGEAKTLNAPPLPTPDPELISR